MSPLSKMKCIFFALLLAVSTDSLPFDKSVQTSSGPIEGTTVHFRGRSVKQYLGVPFAKPPVGDLRFKKPQPTEPWTETLMVNKMPPACIQYLEYPFPWNDFQDGKSEDCLYLNIWVPHKLLQNSESKFPVMFWIYGGGLTVGSNRKPLYKGQALAATGDIIVVTINYRMSAFGFLTSGTDAAPGNVGMFDMLEALKWVNKNIATFGGDPNQVTLAGHSGGSIAIGLLCTSPLTEGLFRGVIMESGSPAYLFDKNNTVNIAKSQKIAKALGCADEDNTIYSNPDAVVNCLRGVDAFQIAMTVNSFHPTSTRSFFPNYGDEILPQNSRISLINGNFHNVPVLIGNNKDEGSFDLSTGHPDVFGFFGQKDHEVNKSYGESLLREAFSSFDNATAVIEHYLGNPRDYGERFYLGADDDSSRIREQVYTAIGDYGLLCPTVYFAESYSRAGNDVYYYFFVHRPSTTPWAKWMGVAHFEEIQFVFGVPLQSPKNYTYPELNLSRSMLRMWSNFVKYGNPGIFDWPLYSKKKPRYLMLDTGGWLSYGQGPHRSNCDFFRPYFEFE